MTTRPFSGSTLVLATHNKGKIVEMRDLLAPYVANVVTSAELNLPEPPETGTTFLKNATTKALATARATKLPALADDSGLSVDFLDGAPGVYSADWSGYPRNYAMARQRMLMAMKGEIDRRAHFTTVLVLAWPDGHLEVAEGRIAGCITESCRGSSGFCYDSLFLPDGYAKTFGEMDLAFKTTISHRTRALQVMMAQCFCK